MFYDTNLFFVLPAGFPFFLARFSFFNFLLPDASRSSTFRPPPLCFRVFCPYFHSGTRDMHVQCTSTRETSSIMHRSILHPSQITHTTYRCHRHHQFLFFKRTVCRPSSNFKLKDDSAGKMLFLLLFSYRLRFNR